MIPFTRPAPSPTPSTSPPPTIQPFHLFHQACDTTIYNSKELRTAWTNAKQTQNIAEMNRVAMLAKHHYAILNQYRDRILEYEERDVDGRREGLRGVLWEEYARMGSVVVEVMRFDRRWGRFGGV